MRPTQKGHFALEQRRSPCDDSTPKTNGITASVTGSRPLGGRARGGCAFLFVLERAACEHCDCAGDRHRNVEP